MLLFRFKMLSLALRAFFSSSFPIPAFFCPAIHSIPSRGFRISRIYSRGFRISRIYCSLFFIFYCISSKDDDDEIFAYVLMLLFRFKMLSLALRAFFVRISHSCVFLSCRTQHSVFADCD